MIAHPKQPPDYHVELLTLGPNRVPVWVDHDGEPYTLLSEPVEIEWPVLPQGYRLLQEGEHTQVGDIYWSTKWYRVSETMERGPYDPAKWGPMARAKQAERT